MKKQNRRAFVKSASAIALAAAATPVLQAAGSSIPVVDCHIHLFDPTRAGSVPWPEKTDTVLYRPALPDRYEKLAKPHGVVGAIAVECSPWVVDNFWLNDVVEKNPIMLGFIGDLLPEAADFAATLDRLHRSPFFLGIRYGNLWGRNLGEVIEKAAFADGLQLLSQAGLVLETANPDPALISAALRVSDRVPDLRIVMDHLPHAAVPEDAGARARYESDLRELAQRPRIFVKGSEILRRVNGSVPLDLSAYKAGLDQIWAFFGEDRVFFGSDWPNSDSLADYDQTFTIAQNYIETRSRTAQEKYFWRNSIAVYRWKPRTTTQSQLQRGVSVG